MTDWTSGYVSDIGYTYGYYPELNPLHSTLPFLNVGLVPPAFGMHCELGYGQGLSVNIHAAATGSSWHATDFNPSQASFAKDLAAASSAHSQLFDQAFADFCNRSDLPDFDSIGLHGIWSWISDENRSHITNLIRQKLKVGGVVYISYNTMPGWAAMVPMRDLLTQHANTMGSPGQGIVGRIDAALEFADKLMAADPAYARANPQVLERLSKLKGQNRNYMAHEYFNRDWLPMPFSRLADWLAPAKLEFACSAHYLDHIDSINFNPEQTSLLSSIADPLFRQTVRDYCINQQFRRDYWVKGARKMSQLEQTEAIRAHKVLLTTPRETVPLTIAGSLGECSLKEEVYNPLLDLLADHKPKTLGQLEVALGASGIPFGHIVQAIVLLTGAGHLLAVQDEKVTAKAKRNCDQLNAVLMNKARSNGDITHLASPVSGGGVAVMRFPQLFLMARTHGLKQPSEWANFVWRILDAQGQRILKGGKTIDSAEANLTELTEQATVFANKQLPILKALQIA